MTLTPKERALSLSRGGMSRETISGVLGITLAQVQALLFEANPNVELPGGAISEVTVQVATTVLDNDQIKALPTTPLELIPAPGPGKVIYVPAIQYVGGAMLRYRWRGHLGNVSDFCRLYLKYNTLPVPPFEGPLPPLGRWEEIRLLLLWEVDADLVVFPGPTDINNSPAPVTDVEDMPVSLWLNNDDAGNLTGGHEDNELQVWVEYSVIELAT